MLATTLSLASAEISRMGMLGAITLGGIFIVFLIVAVVVEERRKVIQLREREETRREIAAYVAEGSMSPEDAERILTAGALSDLKKRFRDAIS